MFLRLPKFLEQNVRDDFEIQNEQNKDIYKMFIKTLLEKIVEKLRKDLKEFQTKRFFKEPKLRTTRKSRSSSYSQTNVNEHESKPKGIKPKRKDSRKRRAKKPNEIHNIDLKIY